ncbi:MAG: hypothetical protein IKE76_02500 [Clostridia bacterium]|nr:hypothetical protein [Clostridia bacterium]
MRGIYRFLLYYNTQTPPGTTPRREFIMAHASIREPFAQNVCLMEYEIVSIFMEIPHNTAAHLAVPFPTSAACRFLDLPPVNLRNLQLHLSKNSLAS